MHHACIPRGQFWNCRCGRAPMICTSRMKNPLRFSCECIFFGWWFCAYVRCTCRMRSSLEMQRTNARTQMKIYLIERKRWIYRCVCVRACVLLGYSHTPSARWYVIFIDLLNHHQSTLFMAVLRIRKTESKKQLTLAFEYTLLRIHLNLFIALKLNGIARYSSHEIGEEKTHVKIIHGF